jgi:hypothetical protein
MHLFNLQNSMNFCVTNKFQVKHLFASVYTGYHEMTTFQCKNIQIQVICEMIIVLEEHKHTWLQPICEGVYLYLDGAIQ